MLIDDVGLWCQIDRAAADGGPALFLDRDGVIVVDTHYLGRAADVRLLDGAAAAIARCNALRVPVVVVTNQAGIARGYYDWEGFQAVQATLSRALAAHGAHLDAVLACAYHAEGCGRLRVASHSWRKPSPGMIVAAAGRMNVDLSRSWIVGDSISDLAAGLAAGLAGGTLLATASSAQQQARSLATRRFVVETAPGLGDAVAALIERGILTEPRPVA